jgi:Zn-dependent protease/CBS domain-containing protein
MKWAWRVGRIFGIDLYVHFTFPLLLIYVTVMHFQRTGGLAGLGFEIAFVLSVFGIVVLHECGHALAARRYGIATRDITLLPIGGVARLERMPDDPKEELVVALAGPAVNVALAAVFCALIRATGRFLGTSEFGLMTGPFLQRMYAVNVFLATFNMIPAFPMDGGRVLRALLALRMNYVRATQVAAALGQVLAVVAGVVGITSQSPLLILVGLFVGMGAAQEAQMVQTRAALAGVTVRRAMITAYETLTPSDPLGRAVDHVLAGFQQDFPVAEGGRVIGVLTRAALIRALGERGRDAPVGEAMDHEFETAAPDDSLNAALGRLHARECHAMPVVEGDRLVGILTLENVGEFLMIESALRGRRGRPPMPAPDDVPEYAESRQL